MGRSSGSVEEFSVFHVILQCSLLGAAFYFWSSPVLQPVKLMVVLFHEMSHGLMALLSGGRVLNIVITADEGGWCESDGGIALLIVSAGYLGSMVVGGLLLYLSRFRGYAAAVYVLLTVTLAAALFTVLHDPYSRRFATALAGAFIFLGLIVPQVLSALLLRVLGTISCLYVLFDIYGDVLANSRTGYGAENDAVAFAQITGVPAQAVGLVWLGLSAGLFFFLLRSVILSPQGRHARAGRAPPAPA